MKAVAAVEAMAGVSGGRARRMGMVGGSVDGWVVGDAGWGCGGEVDSDGLGGRVAGLGVW